MTENTAPLENVSTADVILYDDFLVNAEAKDIEYLLSLEPERFLYNWYKTSGLEPTMESYENSWEQTEGNTFRGHMFGHYMSALSQAYNAKKDGLVGQQLLAKITACVEGIARCQKSYAEKYPERAGYAAPFGEFRLNQLDNVDAGDEEWNRVESGTSIYVPWYNLHKVVAGLIDVYKYVRDDGIGATALRSVCDFVDYVYRCRVSKYTESQKTGMLNTEYGGMAEALYELYNITGKPEHKICADGFIENGLFEQLAAGNDVLSGLHANTTIPKLIGALKKYTVLMQNADYYNALDDDEKLQLDMYYKAAVNFFDIVLDGHSFVTGGNSVNEHFRASNTISAFYQDPETHETCNEYNMLKLARELFKLTREKKYADYYENTFINAILSSQDPQTGEMTYFQPMGAGYSKVFNKERFWCCTGTGTENFTKLGDSIYFKKNERVYVNMYFSSELDYKERYLILKSDADLPNSDRVKLHIGTSGDAVAEGTELYLRIPDWCSGKVALGYNGTMIEYQTDGGYIVLKNVSAGDEIELTLPMEPYISTLKDNLNVVAFCYGPVVLAARMGQKNVGESEPTGILVLHAVQDTSLPTSILLNTADIEQWKADIKENMVRIDDTKDGFVQFKLNGTQLDDSITFVPYYSIYDHRYAVYMNIAAIDSESMQQKILKDKQTQRYEETTSASLMTIDDNNYEATYNVQKSSDSVVAAFGGKNCRIAKEGGWFSYDLPITPGEVNYLNIMYSKTDAGRSFDILINDEVFVREEIVNEKSADDNGFYIRTRKIPEKYTNGDNVKHCEISGKLRPCITVAFRSNGGLVGGIYGISVTRVFDSDPRLLGLSFDVGTLSQPFDRDVKAYTLTVPEETKTVKMQSSPMVNSGLVYDRDILFDDTQPRSIELTGDITEIILTSYAQDHKTSMQYDIVIKRCVGGK